LGTYAANAVNRYAAEASGEEWLTLMGMLGRTRDPGLAYLKRAIAFCAHSSPQPAQEAVQSADRIQSSRR
jgi:hypothetical protein